MSDRHTRWIARGTVFVSYASMVGLGIIQFLRKDSGDVRAVARTLHGVEQPAVKSGDTPAPACHPEPLESTKVPAMESLSLDTPGDSILDRLARRSQAEERDQARSAGPDLPHLGPAGLQSWTHDDAVVADLLETQSLESRRLAGWSDPQPARLAIPTFAPAVMALGIIVFAMGLATVWYVCTIGAVVFAIAAWRWTGELQGG